jgi:hypothetical protein
MKLDTSEPGSFSTADASGYFYRVLCSTPYIRYVNPSSKFRYSALLVDDVPKSEGGGRCGVQLRGWFEHSAGNQVSRQANTVLHVRPKKEKKKKNIP